MSLIHFVDNHFVDNHFADNHFISLKVCYVESSFRRKLFRRQFIRRQFIYTTIHANLHVLQCHQLFLGKRELIDDNNCLLCLCGIGLLTC